MSRHLNLRYGAEPCLRELFLGLCAYASEWEKKELPVDLVPRYGV
jgi:hypothetical protein